MFACYDRLIGGNLHTHMLDVVENAPLTVFWVNQLSIFFTCSLVGALFLLANNSQYYFAGARKNKQTWFTLAYFTVFWFTIPVVLMEAMRRTCSQPIFSLHVQKCVLVSSSASFGCYSGTEFRILMKYFNVYIYLHKSLFLVVITN